MKKKASLLLLYACLSVVGLVFAICCMFIYISVAIFDFMAFLALLAIAGCSLTTDWVRRKRRGSAKRLAH